MDNNDVKTLVEAFRGYRDLLSPIQASLSDFTDTYQQMRGDIDRLNTSFSGDLKGNLESIYKNLAAQADKAADLSNRIDQFVRMTGKYTTDINRLAVALEKAEKSLTAVNELEARAEEQIGKLDAILEEKKKNYNVKELQRNLENYNENVQKVSEFINKDVAESLTQSNKKLEEIRLGNENLTKRLEEENKNLQTLLESFEATGTFIKKAVDSNSVNESYIFEMLDKWAEERKVKRKK
ncbi:hypothetical protein EOM82_00220 [bacterium]|nr:hypothetical protein [bacterium]